MINLSRPFNTLLAMALIAAAGGGCTKAARANRDVNRGDQLFKAGNYPGAEVEYSNACVLSSGRNPRALRGWGLVFAVEGRQAMALGYLQAAAKAQPDDAQVQSELASLWAAAGRPADAKEAARLALKFQPGDEKALLAFCEAIRGPEDAEQTRHYIEQLQKQDQDRASYHLALGMIDARDTNSLAAAETELNAAKSLDPKSSMVHLALARLSAFYKNLKGADEEFKKAVELAPLRSQVRLAYAEFQAQTGATNEARDSMVELTRKAPDYLPPYMFLMRLCFAEHNLDDCMSFISQVLAHEPGNYDALLLKGQVSLLKKDGKQAMEDFSRLLALNPAFSRPQDQYAFGQAYLLNGDRPKAVSCFNRALELDFDASPAFSTDDIKELPTLINKWTGASNALSGYLWNCLSKQEQNVLTNYHISAVSSNQALSALSSNQAQAAVVQALNRIIAGTNIYDSNRFQGIPLRPATTNLLKGGATGLSLVRLNRLLLEDAYPLEISTNHGNYIPAKLELAEMNMEQGNSAAAISMLLPLLKQNYPSQSVTVPASFMLAQSYLQEQAPDQAIAIYANLEKAFPQEAQIPWLEGVAWETENGSSTFSMDDIKELPTLINKWTGASNAVSGYLWNSLSNQDQSVLTNYQMSALSSNQTQAAVIQALNRIIAGPSIYDSNRFQGISLRTETSNLVERGATGQGLARLNRLLLDDAYPLELATNSENKLFQARGAFEKSLVANPDYFLSLKALVELDLAESRLPAALDLVKQHLNRNPTDPALWFLQANIHMEQTFSMEDIKELPTLINQWKEASNAVSGYLWNRLSKQEQTALTNYQMSAFSSNQAQVAVVQALNRIIAGTNIYDSNRFQGISLRPETTNLLNGGATGPSVARLNRLLLEDTHPLEIPRHYDDQAQADLDKVIALDPKLPAPYILLARLYVSQNQQNRALEKLNALVALTNNATAWTQIGFIHDQLKEYDQARLAYEKLLALDPESLVALNNLALLYSEHFNKLDQAYDLASKERKLYPQEPHAADTLGWILYKKGDFPLALSLLRESQEQQAADADVNYHLGMAHYMLGEEEAARLHLKFALSKKDFESTNDALRCLKILDFDPNSSSATDRADLEKQISRQPDPVALIRLAAIQERDGEFEKAGATYEKLIKLSPENSRAIIRLALLDSSKLNQPKKALELAKNAHTLAPDDPAITAALGRMVFHAGDYTFALGLLQAAAVALPSQPDLLRDLAWAFFSVGKVAEARASMQNALHFSLPSDKTNDAVQFLELTAAYGNPPQQAPTLARVQQILQSDPNCAPALMACGLIQEQQGQAGQAQQSYEKVLAAYPLFAPAARQLAILCVRDGNNDTKAFDYAAKAAQAFPDDPELAKVVGIVEYRRKDYSKALQSLTQSARARQDDAELLWYLGMDYNALKQPADAKKTLQQALDLNKLPAKLDAEARKVLALLK